MRPIFGVFWASLALTGLVACSSALPPPPEGNAQANSATGCGSFNKTIAGEQGAPSPSTLGGTVLDGTNGGVHVSCKVTGHGAIDARIESPEMSLVLLSDNVSAGAQMSFYVPDTGNPSLDSIDTTTNRAAPTCIVNTSAPYILKSGSIYASFNCPTVRVAGSTSLQCAVGGYLVFTGCDT
jgi:hypothetical protein